MTPRSTSFHEDDPRKIVEKFLECLANQHPELKNEIEKIKNDETLMNRMVELLKTQKIGDRDINKTDLANPEVLKDLSIKFIAAVSIHTMTLKPETNPLQKILEILKSKGIDLNDPKLNPASKEFDPNELKKELEKKLSPEDALALTNAMKDFNAQILKDLEKFKLTTSPKPTPNGNKPDVEEMTKNLSPYAGLLGVMNHNITGTFAVVVQCVNSNGLGFPDQNPYPGFAPIDRQNDPNDSATFGGDYLGINASTIGKLLTFSGDSFVAEFKQELKGENLAVDSTPSLTRK